MFSLFTFLMLLAMVAVLASLVIGVVAMSRERTPAQAKFSNIMMRLRVLFQALALVFLILAFVSRKYGWTI